MMHGAAPIPENDLTPMVSNAQVAKPRSEPVSKLTPHHQVQWESGLCSCVEGRVQRGKLLDMGNWGAESLKVTLRVTFWLGNRVKPAFVNTSHKTEETLYVWLKK